MRKIIKLCDDNILQCINLVSKDITTYNYFKKIGWSIDQYYQQINKDNNCSFALKINNYLIGFIIGDLIYVEKKIEYEILLLYVQKKHRNNGNATYLIKCISKKMFGKNLSKIILEVAENNSIAINFYKRNDFLEIGLRKNYYRNNSDKKINALLFEKIYD